MTVSDQKISGVLGRLDPAACALLDLSLRHGLSADEIARLASVEVATVISQGETALTCVAAELGLHGSGQIADARALLVELCSEGWPRMPADASNGAPGRPAVARNGHPGTAVGSPSPGSVVAGSATDFAVAGSSTAPVVPGSSTDPAAADDASEQLLTGPEVGETLNGHDVRHKALAGSVLLTVRGTAIRAFGFLGSLVLARLLTPVDFGLVALGSSLLTVASLFSAGGLGGSLIRRPEPPTRLELEALLGLQLAAALLIAAGTAIVASIFFGRSGEIVALMLFSLPLLVLRTPGAIQLERTLSFRPLVAVEISETFVFYVFAAAAVAAGLGVWGFAAAYLVRSAVGSCVILLVVPVGRVWPRLSFKAVRGLLAFGLQYEAAGLLGIVFDQTLNSGTIAIAGVATLGLFSFGRSIWGVPGLIFESLARVSFPAMSRLAHAQEDVAAIVDRTIARVGVLTGILYVGFVGAATPLVTVLFGNRWAGTADVIPWVALSTVIAGPISVTCAGYLYAMGDARSVLRAGIATSLVALGATFGLLLVAHLGVSALGLGMAAGSVADALVLGGATRRRSGARVYGPYARPFTLSVIAGMCTWFAATTVDSHILAAIVGVGVGQGILVGALWLTDRAILIDTVGLARRAFTASLSRTSA